MALDEYTADQLITWYERIEKGILLFGEHVPLTRENETLIAPILASYLLDACGLIDSVFRDMTLDPTVVSSKTVARKDCTIIEFAELHPRATAATGGLSTGDDANGSVLVLLRHGRVLQVWGARGAQATADVPAARARTAL